LLSLPLYIEATRPATRVLAPSVAIGFERTFNRTLEGDRGDAVMHLIAGFVQACPLAWAAGPLRIGPCGRVDVGVIRGVAVVGKTVVAPTPEARTWLAASALARISLSLMRGLDVDMQLGVGAPLVPRYELQLDPSESLGKVGAWHWRAMIGLRLRFL